jgi:hypothetical protein
MTQTVYNEIKNTDNKVAVEIYMHPNNSQASVDDPQTQYRDTVFAIKFYKFELENMGYDQSDEFMKLFDECQTDHIWECGAEKGIFHGDVFHAYKEDAIDELYQQTC